MDFFHQDWIGFNLNFEIKLIREFLLSTQEYFVWLISGKRFYYWTFAHEFKNLHVLMVVKMHNMMMSMVTDMLTEQQLQAIEDIETTYQVTRQKTLTKFHIWRKRGLMCFSRHIDRQLPHRSIFSEQSPHSKSLLNPMLLLFY